MAVEDGRARERRDEREHRNCQPHARTERRSAMGGMLVPLPVAYRAEDKRARLGQCSGMTPESRGGCGRPSVGHLLVAERTVVLG
jgi:hypothetical protein